MGASNENDDAFLWGPAILAVCWVVVLLTATLWAGPEPGSIARARAGLFALSVLVLFLLVIRRSEIRPILKSVYDVVRLRPTVAARDVSNLIFFLLVLASVVALVFVSNVTLVALLGVRVGIVIFILALKTGLDRLRRKI